MVCSDRTWTGLGPGQNWLPQYLAPATKLWQGNVFTPVCHSVHMKGGLPHTPLGWPPGQTPPWAGTPPSRHPGQTPPAQCMLGYGQQAGGTHPTGMQSCTWTFLHCNLNCKCTHTLALHWSRSHSQYSSCSSSVWINHYHIKVYRIIQLLFLRCELRDRIVDPRHQQLPFVVHQLTHQCNKVTHRLVAAQRILHK